MPEPILDPDLLLDALRRLGISRFAGVACSVLDPLLATAEQQGMYLPASVEGEAVALAAGAWLAGETAGVMLQNSGLGNAINPLASLLLPYQIPALFVISWRGGPGKPDALQHHWMGQATLPLLDLFGVPTWTLQASEDIPKVLEGAGVVLAKGLPAALVIPRGVLQKPSTLRSPGKAHFRLSQSISKSIAFSGGETLTRTSAIGAFVERFPLAATVSTTGYISRDLASFGVSPNHFYMQGSMGFSLAIGLGITWVGYKKSVFILDGDGALIMRMGSLVTSGSMSPVNLVHIVLDNGTYGSTGGQPTGSPAVDFCAVALACGYTHVACCEGNSGLLKALDWIEEKQSQGPLFLRIRISPEEKAAADRPEASPSQISQDFRRWLFASN